MAETKPPKQSLVIKLLLPRSEKRGSPSEAVDSRGEKRRKVGIEASAMARSKTQYTTDQYPKSSAEGKSETKCSIVKENSRADVKNSRNGSEEGRLKGEAVKGMKEKKPGVQMDRCKKMQCWVILKRLMIDRDGCAFKQPLDLKDLEVLDNYETISKPMGLEDIESKLNKWLYSGPDEFADDIRLVFSNALLLYPPRNEIYKMARRLKENFEVKWKSLKEKWSSEDGKGKEVFEREVCPKVHRHAAREVHEKEIQKGNKGNSGDLRDSQYRDANKSLLRPKRSTDHSTSQKEINMSISDSQLSPKKASYIAMRKGYCAREHAWLL